VVAIAALVPSGIAAAAPDTGQPDAAFVSSQFMGKHSDGTPQAFAVVNSNESVMPFGVRYHSPTQPINGAVTLDITLPAGAALVRTVTLTPSQTDQTARWTCTGDVPTLSCALLDYRTGGAYPLASDITVQLLLVVRGGPEVAPLSPTDTPVDLTDTTATVTIPRVAGPLTAAVSVPTQAVPGRTPPRLTVQQILRPGTRTPTTGVQDGYDVRVINVGGAPAASFGSTPAVRLTDILPARALPRAVISGTGWSCGTASRGVCRYRGTLAPGAPAPIIKVRWPSILDSDQIKEDWTMHGVVGYTATVVQPPDPSQGGASPPMPKPGTLAFTRDMRLRGLLTKAHLAVNAAAPKGITVLAGAGPRNVQVRVSNVSKNRAPQVAIRVAVAKGVTLTTSTAGWTCSGTTPSFVCTRSTGIAAGDSARFSLQMSAPPTQAAAKGKLVLTPLGRKQVARGKQFEVGMLISDPGDPVATPQVWLKKGTAWGQWRNGGLTRIPSRDSFTYRIVLVNKGGDDLLPGTTVKVAQSIARGMNFQGIAASQGVTCASVKTVSCTFAPSAPVAPGSTFAQINVTVKPETPVARAGLGEIVASVAGYQGHKSLPMAVRVIDNPNSLRPSMKVTQVPSAGGVGRVVMSVRNIGDAGALNIATSTTIPAGLRLTQAAGPGWTCSTRGRRLACRFGTVLRKGASTPRVTLKLNASPGAAGVDILKWNATAVSAADGTRQRGMRKGPLPHRAGIRVSAEATPTVLSASHNKSATRRRVSLDGAKSAGNGVSLDYTWRQRCTTAGDAASFAACKGQVAPSATINHPHVGSTYAVLPVVTTRTQFNFALTITDGSASQTQQVQVVATVPQRLSGSANRRTGGTSPENAARAGSARASASSAARNRAMAISSGNTNRRLTSRQRAALAKQINAGGPRVVIDGGPAVSVTKGEHKTVTAATAGHWAGTASYVWKQVAGPIAEMRDANSRSMSFRAPDESGVLAFSVVATGPAGETAAAMVVVNDDVVPSAKYNSLAKRVNDALRKGGGVSSAQLGNGVTASFGHVASLNASSSTQNQTTSASDGFTFSNTTFTVGGFTIKGASGSVSGAGATVTAGSLAVPTSWGIGPISVSRTSPLVVTMGDTAALLGSVIAANSFALLPLPTGWSGNTTLSFGATSSTITANANGGAGGATVALTGTYNTGGTFTASVTANKLVTVGSAAIDLSGTITNSGGSVVSTITGGIAAPVTLAQGVSVPTLTATWTPEAANGVVVTGSGSIQIESGSATPLTLNAAMSYSNTTNWSLNLTGSGGPTWSPVPGLNLSASNFTGSVAQKAGAWQWDINGTVATWNVTSVLTLNNLTLDLSDQCSGNAPPCPPGSMFIKVGTQAVLDPPLISPVTMNATAILGLGHGGGFSLNAGMQNLDIAPGISLGSPSFNVTYDMPEVSLPSSIGMPSFSGSSEKGFSLTALGSLSVPGLGSFTSIAANITSQGWSLGGFDPNGVSLGAGNGAQSNAYFGWSSFPTTMSVDLPGFGSQSYSVGAGSISVVAGYQVPSWFTKLTGESPGMALGTINFNPTNGFFNAAIQLGGGFNLPSGGSKLDISGLAFNIANNSEGVTVSVSASATMGVKSMNGGAMVNAPTLTLDLGYDVATTNAEASLTFSDPAGWQNAFGVDGLVVNDASFTLMVNLATMTPGLKLLASGVLPNSLVGPFKVPGQGIPITVGAELSASNPCIDFQVGDSKGTQPVLQMDGGAVTANYFEFILAPDGCQLALNQPAIAPGFQMVFDGSILGTTIDVSASLSLDPTVFKAAIDIGSFALGGLQFQETKLAVLLNETQDINDVSFSGGFTIFGNGVNVAGSLDQNGATTSASLKVSQVGTFNVAGFTLSNMMVSAAVTFGPGVDDVAVSATGNMNIMGQEVDVEQFDVTLDNGVVEDVNFDISANITLPGNVATASGNFQMAYTASTGNFDLNAAVVLTTSAGFTIGSQASPATLDISPQCVAFEGTLGVSGVFTAALAGTVVYADGCQQQVQNAAGQLVNGSPGDFSFSADNVALTIGEFDATGSVGVGNVGGLAYAQVSTAITLGTQDAGADVSVAGEFESNGNFNFTGAGSLNLGGFDLGVNVTAANQSGNVSVSGAATVDIAGTTVSVSGSFSEVDGAPSTTLTGSVQNLNLGGFDVGNASITVSQTPQEVSLQGAINMQAGSSSTGQVQASGVVTFVQQVNAPPLFYAAIDASLTLPLSLGSATGSLLFTDCTNSTCSTAAAGTTFNLNATMSQSGFNFAVDVNMGPDGAFSAQGTYADSLCSGTIDLLVAEGQGCFSYQINMLISSNAPYLDLNANATASVEVRTWDPNPWYKPWDWGWGNWYSFSASINANIEIDPFNICVGVMGHDLCV